MCPLKGGAEYLHLLAWLSFLFFWSPRDPHSSFRSLPAATQVFRLHSTSQTLRCFSISGANNLLGTTQNPGGLQWAGASLAVVDVEHSANCPCTEEKPCSRRCRWKPWAGVGMWTPVPREQDYKLAARWFPRTTQAHFQSETGHWQPSKTLI